MEGIPATGKKQNLKENMQCALDMGKKLTLLVS
jgi:hypothetical protein